MNFEEIDGVDMKNLAIIPARSGSKGLKDKNIKELNGKPLIAYTIEAAIKSKMFNEIMVSTDSEKYSKIAQDCGAEVPFLRSEALSTDKASSWDVVRDVVDKYKRIGKEFDTIALLQPTSPLRTYKDIIDGYEKMKEKDANVILSVCETEHSPLWCNILPEDGSFEDFLNADLVNVPRQKLPIYYRVNGALYIVKTQHLMDTEFIYEDKVYAIIMQKGSSIDIDEELDFMLAETIIRNNNRLNDFPKLRKNQEPKPRAFYQDKENLKVIVLGCDPSTKDQEKIFEMVFDIKNHKYDGDYRKNPYFRDIMTNLIWILDNNPKGCDIDSAVARIFNQIYVQNLCPDYLEHDTDFYKNKWSDWIKDDISKAGYIKKLKTELDELDPQKRMPVLLTSSYLLDAVRDRNKIKGKNRKFKTYYQCNRDFIGKEENDLGRVLIPFSRNRRASYQFDSGKNIDYCNKIRKLLGMRELE